MYTKILLPMDGSSASWAAIPHAAYLAQTGSAEVTVLGVIDSPLAEAVSHVLLPLGLPEEHDEAERVIDEVTGELRERGVTSIETRLEQGDPAHQIVACARELHADLIVLGSRHHSAARELFVGSVAESVVRDSPCPVLLIDQDQAHEGAGEA